MITVYGYSISGNCHKLRLLLTQLGREFRWVEVDSTVGQTRAAEYLAKNPNGKVPMIEADDGRIMTESNAILCWLAEGTAFWAGDAWQRAQVLSWMFLNEWRRESVMPTMCAHCVASSCNRASSGRSCRASASPLNTHVTTRWP